MSDVLSRVGLYIDNQNEIRLLEPSIYQRSIELRDLSDQFMAKNGDFRDSVSGFIDGLSQIADQVEREKLQAIGSRTLIKALELQCEANKEQYRNLIRERRQELERMRLEHESLKREDLEQQNLLSILRQLKR